MPRPPRGRLERARRVTPGRKVRVPVAADVHDRIIKDLPAGIQLRPGELRIEFFAAEDLLRHLLELSQAMVNGSAKFEAAAEETGAVARSPWSEELESVINRVDLPGHLAGWLRSRSASSTNEHKLSAV